MFKLPMTSMALAAGMIGNRLKAGLTAAQAYQTMRPVTDRNIGRNWLKGSSGRYLPHQGPREIERRRRQIAAGQISFISHGPGRTPR